MTNDRLAAIGEVGGRIADGLDHLMGDLTSSNVFSDPIEVGDSVVITAAAVERAGGFGFGAGEGDEDEGPSGGGGGGGGGGSASARPVAVIRIHPDGVTVQPVLDATRLLIAALGAFLGLWRALRRR